MGHAEPPVFDTSGPIEDSLFAYIRCMLDMVVGKPSVTIQRLLAVDPAYIRALQGEMRDWSDRHFVQPLQRLLQQASASGEIVIGDVAATARSIVHLVFAEGHSMDPELVATRSPTWQDDCARFLTELVCRGLLPR